MPTVLYVILDPGFGGGHRHVFDVARSVKKIRAVVLCTSDVLAEKLRKVKIPVHVVPEAGRFGSKALGPLVSIIAKEKPALIHAHGPRAGWVVFRTTSGSRIPYFYTEHLWTREYQPESRLAQVLQPRGLRAVCGKAARVIAVSSAVRDFLVEKNIVPADKIVVIGNPIDVPKKFRHHPDKKLLRLGTIASLHPRKGIDVLVSALSFVVEKVPNVRLTIVGDGVARLNLESEAVRLGVRRFIHFEGFSDDLNLFWETRDLYVQPSRDEAFGISAAEALARCIPVVASNVGGLPEVVDGCGALVPPDDPSALSTAIIDLLRDEKRRRALGKAGRDHISKQFLLPGIVGKIESLYLEEIAKNR
jgi:glycosyltransferase involved in cell wall biosynthesis